MHIPWLAVSLLFYCLAVQASSGDRNPGFQWCLAERAASQCAPRVLSMRSTPAWQTLSLRITRWTCEDDCKYQCAHHMTSEALASDGRTPVEQYYGKWAFYRLWGMQEPASVLFSLFNFGAHLTGGLRLLREMDEGHPMRSFYLVFILCNLNLWIWSAVFHTRDTPLTEKMDYFSAAFAILSGLFSTVVRLYHLYDSPATASRRRFMIPWASVCMTAFAMHVTYLIRLPRFDYGYNMKANITIGTAYNLLWMFYSLPRPPFTRFLGISNTYRPSFVLVPLFLSLTMMGAVGLEVFDFPPWWRIIDAHSLWHLATAPVVALWYRFLLADAQDLSWEAVAKKIS